MRFFISKWKNIIFQKPVPAAAKESASQISFELMERLSHELRTSLTGIVGYSEFLESSSTESMVNFTAKIIKECSIDLSRSSNAFFDLHRLESKQIPIVHSVFCLGELAREVVRYHQRQVQSHEVSLLFTCSSDVSFLEMNSDLKLVRQIIDSLVHGAIRFVGKKKSIHFDISLDEDTNCIKLMLIAIDSSSDSAKVRLYKDFWNSDCYKFRLQEGPGVEQALAKALIGLLDGHAEFYASNEQLPHLTVLLPKNYF